MTIAAERQRDEPERERREGGEAAGELRDLREELRAEHDRGRRAVDEEVVALDGRADAGREPTRRASTHEVFMRCVTVYRYTPGCRRSHLMLRCVDGE